MTPTLLILPTSPVPGAAYAIAPIIGGGEPRTAVCQRMKRRHRTVGNELRDADGRVISPGAVYVDEIWEFADAETGELFEREVEVSE